MQSALNFDAKSTYMREAENLRKISETEKEKCRKRQQTETEKEKSRKRKVSKKLTSSRVSVFKKAITEGPYYIDFILLFFQEVYSRESKFCRLDYLQNHHGSNRLVSCIRNNSFPIN